MSNSNKVLPVVIMSPDELLWQGEAESITSENSTGPFDILPHHANFITMIKKKPIVVILKNKEQKKFEYKNAVLSVNDDKVAIYSDI